MVYPEVEAEEGPEKASLDLFRGWPHPSVLCRFPPHASTFIRFARLLEGLCHELCGAFVALEDQHPLLALGDAEAREKRSLGDAARGHMKTVASMKAQDLAEVTEAMAANAITTFVQVSRDAVFDAHIGLRDVPKHIADEFAKARDACNVAVHQKARCTEALMCDDAWLAVDLAIAVTLVIFMDNRFERRYAGTAQVGALRKVAINMRAVNMYIAQSSSGSYETSPFRFEAPEVIDDIDPMHMPVGNGTTVSVQGALGIW
jgi:hypothetical protein